MDWGHAARMKTSTLPLATMAASNHPGTPKRTAPTLLASVPLFADEGGPASPLPVVFLHAAAGDGTHFAAQLQHVRRTRRALAVDLRGHGRSPPAASFAVEAAAGDVAAALDTRGVSRFVLVGHSWGGAVAVALAGAEPGRVAGLLLLDPASDGRLIPRQVADGFMRSLETDYDATTRTYWASLLAHARPPVRERLMREIALAPPTAVVGTLASLLTFDPMTPLGRYRGPRRAVITPLGDRPDAYHALVPGLPVTRIEGTGHWLQLDAPERVNAILDAFLAKVR